MEVNRTDRQEHKLLRGRHLIITLIFFKGTSRVATEDRGILRAEGTAGGRVPGSVVREGELDEDVSGVGVYVGAEESNVAADSRGTGRDAGNVRGCDPGLTVGEGGNDEVVCGVGVDGATGSQVKGQADETAGGREQSSCCKMLGTWR